ncbi:MAG: Ig domain-containing protein [Persicimonas sp.]
MMRSKMMWSVWLVAMALFVLSGCGRDGLAGSCSDDSDCQGDRVCQSGACLNPDEIDAGDPDGAQTCTSDEDCPQSGACEEADGMCVASSCVIPDGASEGQCEEMPCELGCAGFEEQAGCSCSPKSCTDADKCDGYACIDGECGECASDSDCPGGSSCASNGMCVEPEPCSSDRDCPASQQCQDELCVDRPGCLLDDDCDDQETCLNGRCTWAPDCEADADCDDGFECVGGQCFETICRGAEDCSDGQICDAGECVEPPETDSCFVASRTATITANQRVALEAFAVDADGNGVAATFDWTSSDPSVATIESNGRYAVGAGGSGTTTITAKVADTDIECDGRVELTDPGTVADDEVRVIVTDDESGAAVSGAEVVLDNGSTSVTDSSGIATLGDPGGSFDVSVFADDYNYVTVQQVQSTDLRIILSGQSGAGPVAGFTGQFDVNQLNTSGDITLGLAGASIAGGILNLDLQSLLGESFVTQVDIPGMGSTELPLPGGLVLFGQVFGIDLDVKETYYANTSGGARLGWGLAGKVPANRLMQLFQGGGGSGDVLTTLLPLFNRFDHANQPLNLVEHPRVEDTNDLDGDGDTTEMLPDYDSFPDVSLAPSVQQNLVADVEVSNFPQMTDGPAELAVLVGGVLLDSPGFVPMGISATGDEDEDGVPDSSRLAIAPPHGSVAGGRLAVVALSFLPEDVGIQDGIELPDEFSAALWNGQSLPTTVNFGTFPDASTGTVDAGARTVSVSADAGPMFRVRLVGQDRSWDVWSQGPAGAQGTFDHDIEVPSVPTGRDDLFGSSQVFVDAISSQVGLDDLVSATGIGLRDAGLVATGFNRTKLR